MLARALAAEGADMGSRGSPHSCSTSRGSTARAPRLPRWPIARSRSYGRPITTQACGSDTCEAWTDTGHAVVRFVVEGGRWVLRAIVEDAPVLRAQGAGVPHEVQASTGTAATQEVLRARAREVTQVLGEAPLTSSGGTIGVGLTDLSHDIPVIGVREGAATRVLPVDAGTVRADAKEGRWEAGFADVDGDGRTDVLLRMSGKRADGSPLLWTQVFLAPAASVQALTLEPDLATSLAVMDAPDVQAAVRAATSLTRGPRRPR